jgi:hypothetical protein
MKRRSIIFVIVALLTTGCNSDNNTNSSPLLGIWITESCAQASDSNGMPVNVWVKALYEFTTFGTIRVGREVYTDSNCVTLSDTVDPAESQIPIRYADQGQVLLQEGITGGNLLIEMNDGAQLLSVEAFYTINNGALCFSDAFTFEATVFGISQSGTDAIDFNNCLTIH